MRILILGGNGFVGRNLRDHFESMGGLDIVAPSHVELDALDERQVFEWLMHAPYDVVLNCLDSHAVVDASYGENRLRMFHNLANHADLYGKMIYFGSGAEYGRQEPIAKVSEDDFGRVVPNDSYGFALYQMSLHALSSKNIFNLRLFGIFGPYETWQRRFISNMICRGLLGAPLIMRQNRIMDYLYTEDLAKMVRWIMFSNPKHHDYNATSGYGVELRTIAHEVMRQLDLESETLYCAYEGMGPEYTSSNARIAQEMCGFEPMPIRDSIADLIECYKGSIDRIGYDELLLS